MHYQVRRWFRRSGLLFLIIALLTACTATAPVKKQPVEEVVHARRSASEVTPSDLRDMARMQRRLSKVAAPLLLKNTASCRRHVRNLLGFTAQNRYSFSKPLSGMAVSELGLGERLQITGIMLGSSAVRVGLRRGDELLAVAGITLPQGERAEKKASELLAPHVRGQTELSVSIQRGDRRIKYNLPMTRACGFGIALGDSDEPNLYADGQRIMVTRGMLKFVRSDNELAYVIAKGMAHNVLQHPHKLKMSHAARELINDLDVSSEGHFQGAPRLIPMPEEMDVLADRLSLYMLVRAGYDINAAPSFWQHLANNPVANHFTLLHPATESRVGAINKTICDIRLARLRCEP